MSSQACRGAAWPAIAKMSLRATDHRRPGPRSVPAMPQGADAEGGERSRWHQPACLHVGDVGEAGSVPKRCDEAFERVARPLRDALDTAVWAIRDPADQPEPFCGPDDERPIAHALDPSP